MSLHRRITMLAATVAAIGAVTPIAGAGACPNRDASALAAPMAAHHSPGRDHFTTARFVPERVWQQINDAMLVKLLERR